MATAHRPLPRLALAPRSVVLSLGLLLLLGGLALPARGDALPLPAADQELVNQAIDRGVAFLKATQLPVGTWPQKDDKHVTGYTALPGLTLLECGVPADDPAVQRAAKLVRRYAPRLDQTYEISLAILFLDRLGDPKDKKLIQTLALRLVAGQSPTGGWGYKAPVLTPRDSDALLTALRRTEPKSVPLDLVMSNPKDPKSRPADLNPMGGDGNKSNPSDVRTTDLTDPKSRDSKVDAGSPRSPGETENPQALPDDPEKLPPMPRDESRLSPRYAWCIKWEQNPPVSEKAPSQPEPEAPPGKYVIPRHLRDLVVFQDPQRLLLVDPKDRSDKLILCTTDNSNTQFAVLALWAARRHDVPLQRTLALIARRFDTSQNANGSWDYHYRFGGSPTERPAMTAVGLIGVAVGHGLVLDNPGRDAAGRDPRILAGFVALNRNVGTPLGRMKNVPKANLYYLWSVERVAMLYNLQRIGGKDWYRWGAESLVANQGPAGNWAEGQYHNSHPTIDTCLALLFLKRANLAKDLTERLSTIDPKQLDREIEQKAAPTAKDGGKPADKAGGEEPKTPAGPAIEGKPEGSGGVPNSHDSSMQTRADRGDADSPAPRRATWIYAVVILGVLLLAAALAFLAYLISRRYQGDEAEDDRPRARRRARRHGLPHA